MRGFLMTLLSGGGLDVHDYSYSGGSSLSFDGNDWLIEFTSSGVLTLKRSLLVDMYLLGGGQSGGARDRWTQGSGTYTTGGYGGQGGFVTYVYGATLIPGTYTVTIGQGGAKGNLNPGGSTEFAGHIAPGGGSNSHGFAGGAAGGSRGWSNGSNVPTAGTAGADSTCYDFSSTPKNRGGGGSGGYSYKTVGSSNSYNWVTRTGGSLGGGYAMNGSDNTLNAAINPLANYGGGGYGYTSADGGSAGGSGVLQIRNAR